MIKRVNREVSPLFYNAFFYVFGVREKLFCERNAYVSVRLAKLRMSYNITSGF